MKVSFFYQPIYCTPHRRSCSSVGQQFRCPEKRGYFQDDQQCDKFYECNDGIAQERLCPDGLVFDPFSRKQEPCDHYFNVDCGKRLDLQPPKGLNDLCPRLNGFYAHPDAGVCTVFYACVDSIAEEYTCSPGLWFDEYSGVCNWPEATDRTECQKERNALKNGFICPSKAEADAYGVADPHPKYADPDDCAKFYICLNGVTPREQGCELGLVFNTETTQCDTPENVPECKDYYAFLEEEN
ncbi:protein obstructor-E [Lepeophtheirus salmonis]|uniref:protein obstructor-E n=1 Tax=Lepeophtheirus salmonis TaxID=72036 RepID=UPI001AE657DA|nr:protein obstructor-E-like [Lepeophtheirus salmonis]